jgi:hypothetical protein
MIEDRGVLPIVGLMELPLRGVELGEQLAAEDRLVV